MFEGFQAKRMILLNNNLVNNKEVMQLDFLAHYFAQTFLSSLLFRHLNLNISKYLISLITS